MNPSHLCPRCGQALPPAAPHGLCPSCLLQAGFASTVAPGGTASGTQPPAGFVAPSPADLAPHFPQLEILDFVGQGGMGAVYRARQPTLDRPVALKILAPRAAHAPEFAERFTREARALARLSHPHIVTVHDFGQAGAYYYLMMEFVDGMNLRQLLDTATLGAREALAIVPAICSALQYAHDRGIVHRDIKPENILLDRAGGMKIADFGLAKLIGPDAPPVAITGAGEVMGTPHYMAPEQIERPLAVDHRADIYSLGVVFYQMLTGELPLGRFAPPSRRVEVDVRLDDIVLRALEKQPERRYQQAKALQSEVETVAASEPVRRVPEDEHRGPAPASGQPQPPAAKAADAVLRHITRRLGLASGATATHEAPDAATARADGPLIVVPAVDGKLPARCVLTNEPVTAADVRPRKLDWCPPILYWALLLTPLTFLILYFLFRHSVELAIPLGAAGRRQARRRAIVAICLGLAGLAALVGRGFLPPPLQTLALVSGTALLAGASYSAFHASQLLRVVRIRDGDAWIAGADPAFLASLPPYRER